MQKAKNQDAVSRKKRMRIELYEVPCNYGNCVTFAYFDGYSISSFGPVGCPCDNTPGWNRAYLESRGKPHMPMKAKGRHGSRIERGRRRHKDVKGIMMRWMVDENA